jgi:hypothetical protein
MLVANLGVLRASMGHENAHGTLRDYIHKEAMSPGVAQCVDFVEREIVGLNKSKIDIDFWKHGNKGSFRPDSQYVSV